MPAISIGTLQSMAIRSLLACLNSKITNKLPLKFSIAIRNFCYWTMRVYKSKIFSFVDNLFLGSISLEVIIIIYKFSF